MINWNKKTYARELKKGYWDLEPHFSYYSSLEILGLFRTFVDEKMNVDDVRSALYGKFVCEGKPIKKGFYTNFNLISKILRQIIKKVIKDSKIKKMKGGNK